MELAVGQYTRQGPIGAMHKISPFFKGECTLMFGCIGTLITACLSLEFIWNAGTGFATVIMSFFLSTYYNVIIAWAIYYFFSSFSDPLPWKDCGNEWNSELCWNGTTLNSTDLSDNKTSAPQEFYE